jgi:hypothetical protein
MATQTDPTMLALAQLNDPKLYTRYDNIPIFKAHKRKAKDKEGKEFEIVVTDNDLDTIANNIKETIEYEGVPIKFVDGHCKPDPNVSETEQPRFVGWGANPHTGTFGPKNTKAVLVTQFVRNDKVAFLKSGERPFRSAEYYPPSKNISGVALLMRDPYLDMGIVAYDLRDHSPYLYSMDNAMPDPAAPMPSKNEEFTPEEVQHFEKLCRYMQMKGYMAAPAPAPAAPAAGPGAPGGGDTTIPSEKKEEPIMNAKNGEQVNYEKGILELQEKKATCQKLIDQLEAQHYILKQDVEMSVLLPMDEAQRTAYVAYVRETRAQTPNAEPLQIYSGHVEGGVKAPTLKEDDRKALMTYATKLQAAEPDLDATVIYQRAEEFVRAGKHKTA